MFATYLSNLPHVIPWTLTHLSMSLFYNGSDKLIQPLSLLVSSQLLILDKIPLVVFGLTTSLACVASWHGCDEDAIITCLTYKNSYYYYKLVSWNSWAKVSPNYIEPFWFFATSCEFIKTSFSLSRVVLCRDRIYLAGFLLIYSLLLNCDNRKTPYRFP